MIEGSKDGYAYGLCEATGAIVWSNQIGQPGQLDQESIGSIGGFIASPSLGVDNGAATVFFGSAVPLPFSNDGIFGSGDTNITSCPGAVLDDVPLLPVCPDLSLAANPSRLLPLTAVDAAAGTVVWRAASVPTSAATSYTNGAVFAPESLALSIVAYNADTGAPLWAFPLGAAPFVGRRHRRAGSLFRRRHLLRDHRRRAGASPGHRRQGFTDLLSSSRPRSVFNISSTFLQARRGSMAAEIRLAEVNDVRSEP